MSTARRYLFAFFLSLCFVSAAPVLAQVCVPPPADIVGWWPGELNANDVARANNGTIHGIGFTPGMVGQAFSSDGTGGQVSIGAPNFETPNTGFTVETWINPISLGYCWANDCKTIAHRELNSGSRTWWLGIDGPWIRFLLFLWQPNGGRVDIYSPAVVVPGTLQHIAASYDGNTVRLYYNGSLVATQVVGTASFNLGDPINIAIENLTVHGSYDSFHGSIDELSIYNRALSDLEIGQIFGAGTAGKCLADPEVDVEHDEQNNNGQHDEGEHADGSHER